MKRPRKQTIMYSGEPIHLSEEHIATSFQLFPSPPQLNPKEIACGRRHLLVLDVDNQVWVAGDGGCGQLGLGEEILYSHQLVKLNTEFLFDQRKKQNPTQISRIANSGKGTWSRIKLSPPVAFDYIISIICGPITSALVTKSGRLFIWGYTYSGKYYVPEEVVIGEGLLVREMAVGDQHIVVIVEHEDSDRPYKHSIYTWGKSSAGALGHGREHRIVLEPTRVEFFDNINIKSITAGPSASAVLTKENECYIFGTILKHTDWHPRKLDIPDVSIIHLASKFALLFADGKNLYSMGVSGLQILKEGVVHDDSGGFTLVESFDVTAASTIVSIHTGRYYAAMRNIRGQLITLGRNDFGELGRDNNSLPFPLLNHPKGFVSTHSCCSRCTFIVIDAPLLQHSVEKIVEHQGDYNPNEAQIPYIIRDISRYFSEKDILIEATEEASNRWNNYEREPVEALYEQYSEFTCTYQTLSEKAPREVFGLLCHFLIQLREAIIPTNLHTFLVEKLRGSTFVSEQIDVIDAFVSMLPPVNRLVTQRVLAIFNKIYSQQIVKDNLEQTMFALLFGDVDKKFISSLKRVFSVLLQFSDRWFTEGHCLLEMKLELVSSADLNSLLSEVVHLISICQENENKETLKRLLVTTPIVKMITKQFFSEPGDWDDFIKILSFFISKENAVEAVTALKKLIEKKSRISEKCIDAACAVIHLSLSTNLLQPLQLLLSQFSRG